MVTVANLRDTAGHWSKLWLKLFHHQLSFTAVERYTSSQNHSFPDAILPHVKWIIPLSSVGHPTLTNRSAVKYSTHSYTTLVSHCQSHFIHYLDKTLLKKRFTTWKQSTTRWFLGELPKNTIENVWIQKTFVNIIENVCLTITVILATRTNNKCDFQSLLRLGTCKTSFMILSIQVLPSWKQQLFSSLAHWS